MPPLDLANDQRIAMHPAVLLQRLSRGAGGLQQVSVQQNLVQEGGTSIYGSCVDMDMEDVLELDYNEDL
jgi:hypothetical protein